MDNRYAYIEKLLKRFFDGQSTLDEEAELASFFIKNDVPEEWLQYKKMFQYLDTLKPDENKRHISWHAWLLRVGTAAAVIAVLTVIGLRFFNTQQNTTGNHPSTATAKTTPTPTAVPDTAAVVAAPERPAKVSSSTLAGTKPRHKARRVKMNTTVSTTDSAEIIHTEGELEKAEQEYIADRLILEQELRRNQPQNTSRSGWITTSLNIQ